MTRLGANRHLDGRLAARAGIAGVLLGAVFAGIAFPLAILVGIPPAWRLPFCAGAGIAIGFLISYLVAGTSNAAGNAIARFIQPSGRTTPYRATYSYEQSLAARGEVARAVAAYGEAMLNNPFDPEPRLQAAELLLRSGDAARAAELFTQARDLTSDDRARELYVTQRLVDLHLGPLSRPGRALVELRRLSERFPGTPEAAAARQTIQRLKANLRPE